MKPGKQSRADTEREGRGHQYKVEIRPVHILKQRLLSSGGLVTGVATQHGVEGGVPVVGGGARGGIMCELGR